MPLVPSTLSDQTPPCQIPQWEVSDSARIAANVDDDAVRRGEQQGIPDLADDGVQAIVVLAREPDELLDRRPVDA